MSGTVDSGGDTLVGTVWNPASGRPSPRRHTGANTTVALTGSGIACEVAAPSGRALAADPAGWQYATIGLPHARTHDAGQSLDLRGLAPGRTDRLAQLGGAFLLAGWHETSRTLLIASDRFASRPLYWWSDADRIVFGTDIEWVVQEAGIAREVDPQALYDYLFFSVVPSNRSALRGIRKLPAASTLTCAGGRVSIERYWQPDFARQPADRSELEQATVGCISAAVARYAALPDVGCFLSGGLDSSTVSGLAMRARQRTTPVFTIGYDVAEFDESHYARVTARHFGLELHEHRIRSEDIADSVSRVVNGFPEPFGNPSAVSAYLCADFARAAGIRNLLAGDGGDEIFGGNERYQKQSLFNLYGDLPAWLRRGVVDPLAALTQSAPGPLPKLMSYVRQARVPLPDRLFSYNLLVRNDPAAVLTSEFLRSVNPQSPYDYARAIYREPPAGDPLDRMLYLDWTTTLTDNDLPKVNVACRLAGVTAHFPLLDPDVIDVSTRVPSDWKLTLRELRRFYKSAFRDVLPAEILSKPKHGFGVPVGIWVNRDAALRARIGSRLEELGRRGIVRPEIVSNLLQLQASEHASYYGALLWPLFALEEWLQGHGF